MEISFIHMYMSQKLRMNKTNFHMKGFALRLALKLRRNATRKSPNALHTSGNTSLLLTCKTHLSAHAQVAILAIQTLARMTEHADEWGTATTAFARTNTREFIVEVSAEFLRKDHNFGRISR